MSVQYVRYEMAGWRDASRPVPPVVAADIAGKFKPPDGCLLLAYDPDTPEKVIGSAGFSKLHPGICEASRVVVGWSHQRKGIGLGLMSALMAEARKAGYHTMRIAVPRNNPALMKFVTFLNFRQISCETGAQPALALFEISLNENAQPHGTNSAAGSFGQRQ